MSIELVVTHTHLNDAKFQADVKETVQRARSVGVTRMINMGDTLESSERAVNLAESYEGRYAGVGIHPEEAVEMTSREDDILAGWTDMPKVVAIGEIGLDYYWKGNAPKDVQKRSLLEQLDLAKQFDLPVIIHDRDAHGDILEIFQKEVTGVRAVFHCYSGSLEMAKELLKRGFYLGFGGTSTYKNAAKVREVLQYVPDDLLLFETDSPYLTPVPYRGKRNQPGYTELVARNAAEVRGTTFEALAAQTTKNVKTLFNKIK